MLAISYINTYSKVKRELKLTIIFLVLAISDLFAQDSVDIKEEVQVKFTLLLIFIAVAVVGFVVFYFFNKKVLPSDLMEKARVANVDISDFGRWSIARKKNLVIDLR